jgi:hypothetical protein
LSVQSGEVINPEQLEIPFNADMAKRVLAIRAEFDVD